MASNGTKRSGTRRSQSKEKPSVAVARRASSRGKKSPLRKKKKKRKKIDKKHPEFELTYDMMLGIRTTVSRVESKPWRDLRAEDFEDFSHLRFPSEGGLFTPAHSMRDFKFKDYQPEVFRHLRERFSIKPEDYLMCVCGNFQYLEFISNSKSGQFFFYTHDRQFMIKTVSQDECKYLRRILPHYYEHVMANPNTLLTRFYGMHRVKPHKKREKHFLIFGSIFWTDKYIHKTFDLKGSSLGRAATKKEKESGNPVYKDNDFTDMKIKIRVGPEKAKLLKDQIAKDVEFLRQLNIMDYSLLLGIHDRRLPTDEDEKGAEMSKVVKDNTQKNAAAGSAAQPAAAADAASSATGQDAAVDIKVDAPPKRNRRGTAVAEAQIDQDDHEHLVDMMQHMPAHARAMSKDDMALLGGGADTSITSRARQQRHSVDLTHPPPIQRSLTTPGVHTHQRRQSRYGLPRKYNKISKPEDIMFVAPEFEPVKVESTQPKADEKDQAPEPTVESIQSVFTKDDGGIRGMDQNGQPTNETYFFGIIDILTIYGMKKRFEHTFKSVQYDSKTISAVNPKVYANRFKEFLYAAIE